MIVLYLYKSAIEWEESSGGSDLRFRGSVPASCELPPAPGERDSIINMDTLTPQTLRNKRPSGIKTNK